MQGYKDCEQGKKPRYPLKDDEEMTSEDAEEEASGDEGSDEHKESRDAKKTKA